MSRTDAGHFRVLRSPDASGQKRDVPVAVANMPAQVSAPALTVVLADDHVLNGLPGSCHVHGVGQVCPADGRVVDFLLEHLISVVAHNAWDVIILYKYSAVRKAVWRSVEYKSRECYTHPFICVVRNCK